MINPPHNLVFRPSFRPYGLEPDAILNGKNLIGNMFIRLLSILIILVLANSSALAAVDLGTGVQHIPSGTNLGIGTTTPAQALEVNGQVLATTFNGDGAALTNVVATVAADSLDFDDFMDTMTLDATTAITMANGDLNLDANTLYIDSSANNVGVGTATPSNFKLEVVGTVGATAFNGDGAGISNIGANGLTADTLDFAQFRDTMTLDANTNITMANGDLNLENNSLVLDSSVNGLALGVATAGAQFHVDADGVTSANAEILMTSVNNYNWMFGVDNGDTDKFKISNGNNLAADPAITILNNGDVGINTTTPGEALEVSGTIKATLFNGSGSGLTGVVGTVAADSLDFDDFMDTMTLDATTAITMANGDLNLDANTLYIDSSANNVGVGTATPSNFKLEVVGTVGATAFNGDGAGISNIGANGLTADTLDFAQFRDTMTLDANTNITMANGDLNLENNSLVLDSSVNGLALGVATAGAQFHIDADGVTSANAEILMTSVNNYNWMFGVDNGDTDKFKISNGNNLAADPAITILNNGDVGINTTTPGEALEVSGTIKATLFNGSGSGLTGVVGTVAADSLDFDDFMDTMTLDATTAITMANGDLNLDANTLYIDSSANNVGVGTATPSNFKLEVVGTVGATAFNGDGAGISNIGANGLTADTLDFAQFRDTMTLDANTNITMANGDLNLENNSLVLDSSVNGLALGVATAGAQFHIDADGVTSANAEILMTSVNNYNWMFGVDNGDTDKFKISNGNNLAADPAITILNNGDVGINTTTPGEALEVSGTVKATLFNGSGSGLTGVVGTVAADSLDFDDFMDTMTLDATTAITMANGDLNLDANTLYIDSSANNVGVGTATPSNFKLEVVGTVGATAFNGDGAGISNIGANGLTADTLDFAQFRDTMTLDANTNITMANGDLNLENNSLVLDSSVNGVALGVATAGAQFHIDADGVTSANAEILMTSVNNYNWMFGVDNGDTDKFKISNGNNLAADPAITILNNGDVGINTTTPGEALEVSGTIKATLFNGSGAGLTNVVATVAADSLDFDDFMDTMTLDATTAITMANGDLNLDANTLYIDSSANNVGVGTATPSNFKLEVVGTVGATAFNGDGAGISNIGANGLTADTLDFAQFRDTMTLDANTNITMANGDLNLENNSLVLDSSVNGLALGVATAGAQFHIDADGVTSANAEILMTSVNNYNWMFGVDNGDTDKFKISNGNNLAADPAITILNNGDVGINTTTPAEALHVAGTVKATTFNGSGAGLTNVVATVAADSLDFDDFMDTMTLDATTAITMANGDLNLDANTLYIDSSANNVGVGTATPSNFKLEVVGTVGATAFNGDGAGISNIGANGIEADALDFAQFRDTMTLDANTNITMANGDLNLENNTLVLDSSVNGLALGVATAGAQFHIDADGVTSANAEILMTSVNNYNWMFGVDNGDTDKFKISNGNNLAADPAITILNNGDVGINTTTPAEALHVAGTVKATTFNGSGAGLTNVVATVAADSLDFDDFMDTMTLDATTAITMANGDLNLDANTLYIDSSANNVGVGTATPSNFKLEVVGTVGATYFNGDGAGISNIGANGLTADALDFAQFKDTMTLDANTNITMANGDLNLENNSLVLDSSVNGLALGVATAGAQFHVDADGVTSANAEILMTSVDDYDWMFGVDNGDSNKFKISNGNNLAADPAITIINNGNVGIGLTSPSEILSIEGAIALDEISAPSTTSGYGKLYVGTDSNLYFLSDSGTTTLVSNGTAGGGGGGGDVSASANMVDHSLIRGDGGVKGVQDSNIIIDDSENITGVTSLTINGTGSTALVVNGNKLVLDASAGELGIGTASPGAQLHIDSNGATSTNNAEILMTDNGNTNWILGIDNGDSGNFKLTSGNALGTSPAITVATNGDVCVGINAPVELLTVNGAFALAEISAPSSSSGYGKLYVNTADSNLYFLSSAGDTIKLDNGSTGNVNAASTITDHAIVRGDGGSEGIQESSIVIDDNDNIGNVTGLEIVGENGTAFIVNGSTFIVDSTNGMIAIGTSSPAAQLHIDADGATNSANAEVLMTSASDDQWIYGVNGSSFKIANGADLTSTAAVTILSGGNVGIDTTSPGIKLEVNGDMQVNETFVYDSLVDNTSGAAVTVDWTVGNKQKITMGHNVTFTFTAPPGVASLTLFLYQDGTGSRTATWPATVKWPSDTAPTLTTTASDLDIISCTYDGSTNYYCQAGIGFNP